MEVLSFISSNKKIIDYFQEFINTWSGLRFGSHDEDTKFYINPATGQNELYFHFVYNIVDDEFEYNYTIEDLFIIKNYFGNEDLYIFDVQFRNELLINNLLNCFSIFLCSKNQNLNKDLLISHPFKGILKL